MKSSLYFEDFHIGEIFESPSRSITEADIVNFAGLSGDYNLIHTDVEFAKSSIFGERIAHGILGMSIASGLFTRTDLNRRMSETLIALMGIESWKFILPIKIGDTIRLKIEILDKKTTSKPNRGIVSFKRTVVNQNEEIVQEGITPMMITKKMDIGGE